MPYVVIQVAKALTIQNHASAGVLVDKLFDLFDDADIGWDAAKAIGRIASGGEYVLTKQNHAVIRVSNSLHMHCVRLRQVFLDIIRTKVLQVSTA